MKKSEIVSILENSLNTLRNQRCLCVSSGDLAQVLAIDEKIAETEITLSELS